MGTVACSVCGLPLDLPAVHTGPATARDIVPLLKHTPGNPRVEAWPRLDHACPVCGATVVYEAEAGGTLCPACGTPSLRPQRRFDAPLVPDGVVPFLVDESEARAAMLEWARRHVGRSARRSVDVRALGALYVWCWQFTAHGHASWEARTEDEVETGNVEGDFSAFVPAPSGVASVLDTMEPHEVSPAVRFDAQYLAGTTLSDFPPGFWAAWEVARASLQDQIEKEARRDAGLLGFPDVLSRWSRETVTLLLIPAYVGTFDARGQEWPVVVHGASGRVEGTSPPDPIAATTGCAIVVTAVALGWLALTRGCAWLAELAAATSRAVP